MENTKIDMSNVIKQAIKEYENEKNRHKRKHLYQNTKKMLSIYGQLNGYLQDAVDHIDNNLADKLRLAFESTLEEGDEDYPYIHSIRQSKLRTAIILEHISRALDRCKAYYTEHNEEEKYKALIYIHLEQREIGEVAEKLNCSENTARRWANEVIRDNLNIELYGADGVELKL